MKMKSVVSSVAAFALAAASFVGEFPQYFPVAYAEEVAAGGTEEVKELNAPQNVRVEDGFLKWDGSENDYGYNVTATDNNGNVFIKEWYEPEIELDRFCYDRSMDFGSYEFKVCVIDEAYNVSEYSETATFSYAPNFSAPTNVRFDETDSKNIIWDEVSGAVRYNVRIYKDDENRTLDTSLYLNSNSFHTDSWLSETGNYLVSFQAMDTDYNVSEWTEPIPYTYTKPATLEAPKNVRLDESGENILWDEVENAEYYWVRFYADLTDDSGRQYTIYESDYPREPYCTNWKSFTVPFSKAEYSIYVLACNGDIRSEDSEVFNVSSEMTIGESLSVPDVQLENNILQWDNVDGIDKYWITISINGQNQEISGSYCYLGYSSNMSYEFYNTNQMPIGDYDVNLYVVDQHYNYNKKTFPLTLGQSPDESVWIPKMFFKFDDILWDYDTLRHDDTECFWVRIKKAKDDTVVKLQKTYYERLQGFWDLPNDDYTLEICTCIYDKNDNQYKISNWSEPHNVQIHGEYGFDKENEVTESVEAPPEAADIPEEDRITSITINPAFNMKHKDDNNVELDLTKIKIKAKEIYDEEGLKRASEALGETIKGNTHYNLLDLTLLYGEEDFSNSYNGLVQVIIPLPKGHRDKTFSCYRLKEENGKTVKELIPGEQTEDSYIIYLEHFSEYALVGVGEGDEPGTTTPAADFYKIDLKTDGHGTVSANVENTEKVEEGTEVTLTAKPNSGYKFSKWTVTKGDVTIKDNKFTMPGSDVEITAEFAKTSSGGSVSSGGSSGGSRRPSSTSTTAETVTVNGKTGSWSDVTGAINSAANGATITISGSVEIPSDVIAAAAKKNVKLEVKVNDDFTWVIDAAKVGESTKYLSISDAVINNTNKTIKNGESYKDFRITESKLGTGAFLRCNAGKSNSGKFANLFRVNGSALEFVCVVKIDAAGNALLPITAAGAYKVVISDETKLVGDLDNSTGLNALDAAAMLKKLVNSEVTADMTAKFDYNGDGKANALDAAALLKMLVS